MIRCLVLATALLATACADDRPSPPGVIGQPPAVWKRVGAWSGRGAGQTTTFLTEHPEWRLNWQAKRTGGSDGARLTVRVHSADSGRILDVPLEDVAPGAGTVEVFEDPRVFYLSVEAGDLEWRLSAEERIPTP